MDRDRALAGAFLLVLLVLLSSTASGLGSVVSRYFIYKTEHETWEEARSFCRTYYTDLAVFYTQSEADSVNSEQYYAWIGLHKDTNSSANDWVWSDGGHLNFSEWGRNRTEGDDCAAVDYWTTKGWGTDCEKVMFFICQEKEGTHFEYTFIPESKTWSEAQQYCRTNYDDLASLSKSDLDAAVDQREFPVWVGRRREGATWNWITGLSDYSNWKAHEPENSSDCVSISSINKDMATQNCDDHFPFICISENVFLMKENKTWEEALEHCRALNFDLLSVQPSDQHNYLMSKILESDTEEVWTGLRFLAGEWLWVNGADMLYTDLPSCPILGHHCGAASKKGLDSFEIRDCMERKNFLCYRP